jgi:UDP-N-acetylglucosamine 2-epimerase (non-hydrolysing)
MPEEHNRVLIDHLADVCWAPTHGNVSNLASEGISGARVIKTGNPIVEALADISPTPEEVEATLREFDVGHRSFVLVTLHRPENVDDPKRLARILNHLGRLAVPVIFPMHPRTRATARLANIDIPDAIHVVDPVGYRVFLALLGASSLVVSDSGGVQEEVSIMKVPMIVLRRSTERPEMLGTFASLTDDPEEMFDSALSVLDSGARLFGDLADVPCPYGDGTASQRMMESLDAALSGRL